MDETRALLQHFLAAIAYRTQKALKGAPAAFASFRAAPRVRTPHELIAHMDSVLGYALTLFHSGTYRPAVLPDFDAQVIGFHGKLAEISRLLEEAAPWTAITPQRLLQGPLSDVMTHAGQLALLRRLAGSPVPPENFVYADIGAGNVGPDQPEPASPDAVWPERPES